jgi:hypothetical protein
MIEHSACGGCEGSRRESCCELACWWRRARESGETGRYAGGEILGTIYEAGKMDKIRHRRRVEKHMIQYKGEKGANSQVKDLKTSFGDMIECAVEGRRKMYERVKADGGRLS